MINHLAFHVPSTVLSIRPTSYLSPRRLSLRPSQVHLRPRRLCLCPSQVHLRPRRLYPRPRQVHLKPRRLYPRPRQVHLRPSAYIYAQENYIYAGDDYVYKQDFIFTVASLLELGLRRFCSLSLRQAFAVSTHVVFSPRTNSIVLLRPWP